MATPLETARPKMLQDSIFLPTKYGLFFRSRTDAFTLKGLGVHELFSTLVPHFEGKLTVSDICSRLDPQKTEVIHQLIATLLQRRIVIDHVDDTSDLGVSVLEAFRSQIEFIEHLVEQPAERFKRFRQSRVLLTGSGIPLRALVLSLARNGLETIILDDEAAEISQDGELTALAEELRSKKVPFSFEQISLKKVLETQSHSLTAICYLSDTADLNEMLAINKYCCEKKIQFVPGILFGGKAFVGPLVQTNHSGCWLCFLLRRTANVEPELEALLWKHLALGNPWRSDCVNTASPSLRILGNMAGFELFRFLVGHIPTETEGSALSLDLETLETSRSRLLPHPLCPHCSNGKASDNHHLRSWPNSTASEEPLNLPRKLELTSALIDGQCGIARGFDDYDLLQAPLFRTSLSMSRYPGAAPDSIPGHSIESNTSAQLDAILSAVESYVLSVADRRRMLTATLQEATNLGWSMVPETVLSGWMGGMPAERHEAIPWMQALSLRTGTIGLVPASAIYPRSFFNVGSFEKVDVGIGVGFTFEEASENAVLSLFTHEVLKRVARGDARLIEVAPQSLGAANKDLSFLLSMLDNYAVPIRLLKFTHKPFGTVALACDGEGSSDQARVTVGVAKTLPEAAARALTDFLALTMGGKSMRTVARYLPHCLGYAFELPARSDAPQEWRPALESTSRSKSSVLSAFDGDFTDVLLADATPDDVAKTGVITVKALFQKKIFAVH